MARESATPHIGLWDPPRFKGENVSFVGHIRPVAFEDTHAELVYFAMESGLEVRALETEMAARGLTIAP